MRPGPQVSHRRPAHIKQGCGDVEAALPFSRGDWAAVAPLGAARRPIVTADVRLGGHVGTWSSLKLATQT